MSKPHGTKDFWLAALRAEAPLFRTAVAAAAAETPVPTCPGWTVRDLAHHLGEVYQFVASHVGRGEVSRPERPPAPDVRGDELVDLAEVVHQVAHCPPWTGGNRGFERGGGRGGAEQRCFRP